MDFTTLIIGAGASAAFGFPTGAALTDFFASQYPNILQKKFVNKAGYFVNDKSLNYYNNAIEIQKLIKLGKFQSIDLVISRFPELAESAKLGISIWYQDKKT